MISNHSKFSNLAIKLKDNFLNSSSESLDFIKNFDDSKMSSQEKSRFLSSFIGNYVRRPTQSQNHVDKLSHLFQKGWGDTILSQEQSHQNTSGKEQLEIFIQRQDYTVTNVDVRTLDRRVEELHAAFKKLFSCSTDAKNSYQS